jgi:hypothetical protein
MCPCGSGKKYKRRCGGASVNLRLPGIPITDQVCVERASTGTAIAFGWVISY